MIAFLAKGEPQKVVKKIGRKKGDRLRTAKSTDDQQTTNDLRTHDASLPPPFGMKSDSDDGTRATVAQMETTAATTANHAVRDPIDPTYMVDNKIHDEKVVIETKDDERTLLLIYKKNVRVPVSATSAFSPVPMEEDAQTKPAPTKEAANEPAPPSKPTWRHTHSF